MMTLCISDVIDIRYCSSISSIIYSLITVSVAVCSRRLHTMLSSIIIVIFYQLYATITLNDAQTVDRNLRIDCYPDQGASESSCESRGCIWDPNFDPSHTTIPLCYFPSTTGYELTGLPDANPAVIRKKSTGASNPFGIDMQTLNVQRTTIGKTLNVKIAPTINR